MTHPIRRRFLHRGLYVAQLTAVGLLLPAAGNALAARVGKIRRSQSPQSKQLSFEHLHTLEKTTVIYAIGPDFVPGALRHLNYFLRDHYNNAVGRMDRKLFNLLHQVRRELGTSAPFQVISAYRSLETNEMLRTTRGGGVATRSLHMEGKAIDVRLPGVLLTELRDAAIDLKGGGVGFYSRDNFVHIDTGQVRTW